MSQTENATDHTSTQTALVTGAGKRIGRAIALALGKSGFDVGVHYFASDHDANHVVGMIQQFGQKAVAVKGDLANQSDVGSLIARTRTAFGQPLSLLVNCASTFENDSLSALTRESWDRHMEANLWAPVALMRDFSNQIHPGANNLIVNLTDQRVWKLTPQFFSYTLSKVALANLTKTAAQELGPKGIRVNAIGPGPTLRNKRQSEDDWQKQNAATVLGYGATPEDIVAALFYLINARSVTGQMIAVDGGQHLAWQTPDTQIDE